MVSLFFKLLDKQKDSSVAKCQNTEEIKIESASTKPVQLPAVKDFPKSSQTKLKSARGTLNPGLLNLKKVKKHIQ